MTSHTAASTGHDDAWCLMLDRLELDVDRVEAALDAGEVLESRPWTPPSDLGPLPEALVERAADVLTRLHDVADELRAARDVALGEAQRTRQRRDATVAYHATG